MGPTASGKSGLALELARKFSGEIVSADSMQLYRGLNIGVAKPTPEEQREIPHHLIDVLDISEPVDVFRFAELAESAISDILSRNRLPIVAGGSGMYLRALLYGLDPLPADPELKKKLLAEYGNNDQLPKLREVMKVRDPDAYERWNQHHRKLLRALEVLELTGKSITAQQKSWDKNSCRPATVWNLVWEREELKKRIRERTAQMLANGWIEEAKKLIGQGLLETPTAYQALGYRLIGDHLNGKLSREELEAKIVTATWQFARRQLTWFRNQHPEAETINMPIPFSKLQTNFG